MNKAVFILFSVFIFQLNSISQNLIYNGDFEIYDTCPNSLSQPGDFQIERCLGWKSPTLATSDYFNGCANWPVGVPNNSMGNVLPHSGNGYCGILIEDCKNSFCSAYWGFWIEYIHSELLSPLIAGNEYKFSCFVANSFKSDFAFAKFGALFTTNPLTINNARPIELNPQIINISTNYLIDTLWTKVTGSFIASGNESYITLGFFIDTNNLDTLRMNNQWQVDPLHYQSYYFIDSCNLIPTGNNYYYPNIFTPNNDGENDYWKPFVSQDGIEIKIYNRWGNQVALLNDENLFWNGTSSRNEICAEGIYYFITNKFEKGFIQLTR